MRIQFRARTRCSSPALENIAQICGRARLSLRPSSSARSVSKARRATFSSSRQPSRPSFTRRSQSAVFFRNSFSFVMALREPATRGENDSLVTKHILPTGTFGASFPGMRPLTKRVSKANSRYSSITTGLTLSRVRDLVRRGRGNSPL
jgi:hypothetical protein